MEKKRKKVKIIFRYFFLPSENCQNLLKIDQKLKSVKMSENGHFLTHKVAYLLHFSTNFNESFWRMKILV